MRSIDRLYQKVQTPYIFQLEDDWEFDGPISWEAAKAILEMDKGVANVCVRKFGEIKEKYRNRSSRAFIGGEEFALMNRDAHPEWFAWSSNPGLIKTTLYNDFKPFGRVYGDQMSGIMKKAGLTQAWLLPGVARHIGQGRNVTDPTMPARATKPLGKLSRRWKKNLYYLGLRRDPF